MGFIGIVDETDRLYPYSSKIFESAKNSSITVFASIVSLMECSYVLKKIIRKDSQVTEILHMLLSLENVHYLPLTSNIFVEATDFIVNYKLSLSDALIAATFLKVENAEFISSDSDFDSIPFIRRISLEEIKL
ncbi:type II toxin-antitoxin system VapC family toxin [Candidatus Micrarchaeota archaeon]|nr:type II toxin-antitoxin system VapC family toxin [Candidatus Micrarchaeota archaeon]